MLFGQLKDRHGSHGSILFFGGEGWGRNNRGNKWQQNADCVCGVGKQSNQKAPPTSMHIQKRKEKEMREEKTKRKIKGTGEEEFFF